MTKVFKIPDGDGGIRYRIQTPDGLWHDTDESGNLLGEDSPKTEDKVQDPTAAPFRQRKETVRSPKPQSEKARHYVNFSIQIPQEDYRMLSDYVHWRSLFKQECSKGGFLLKLGMDTIRKDREFQLFIKNTKKE